MSRNKKIFLGFAIVFFALLFYASYDIATRTTFPGSKPQLKERIERDYVKKDSLNQDSLEVKR
ncbi:MAG TPA: hypothetical protein PLV21_07055 [Cyclobacteriaceae bacterium]|nr:hypothetical protein [Cyclobacteriaceae bacterium]HRJ81623.1 hypothetical protein [Cyclobacteriaceae bacterium]